MTVKWIGAMSTRSKWKQKDKYHMTRGTLTMTRNKVSGKVVYSLWDKGVSIMYSRDKDAIFARANEVGK